MFHHLKAGDTVFVVWQKGWRPSDKKQPTKTECAVITKKGRKYGYLGNNNRYVFDLDNGHSVHDANCNARANGHGFDVYLNEKTYLDLVALNKAKSDFRKRLSINWNVAINLSLSAIDEINAILDREGV